MAMGKAGQIRGMRTLMLLVLIFLGVLSIFILGIMTFGANLVDQTFSSLNITIGNVSFIDSYDDTLGIGINSILNNVDNYGMIFLLGMVLLMAISGFMFKEKQKVWIVAEFVLLIIAMIFAVTLTGAYTTIINSSTELLDIYSVDLVDSSRFILNLPIIVPIVWAFIVILSYGLFPKKEETQFGDLGA